MTTKCEYFKIYELVDKPTFEKYGEKAWEFFDENALNTLDLLRGTFGPATVNDWKWGRTYKYSGLRTPQCKIGASMSQHRFGRAFDVKFKNASAGEVRKHIKSDQEYWSEHISRIENGVSWFHYDICNVKGIQWFNP
jgi:hypothetical protein